MLITLIGSIMTVVAAVIIAIGCSHCFSNSFAVITATPTVVVAAVAVVTATNKQDIIFNGISIEGSLDVVTVDVVEVVTVVIVCPIVVVVITIPMVVRLASGVVVRGG